MHETDIDRTVARAKLGDPTAIGELYDVFGQRVYRFVIVRVRSAADAEDLLQRIFLKVIESLPRYEQRGLPFAAWLFRIARNTVIDHDRTRRDHASLDASLERADGRRGPEELAEVALERAALRSAIERLTQEQRDVVTYRFFAGLSTREIALLMDRQEGAIRALQFRAIQTLRETIGNDVEFAASESRA